MRMSEQFGELATALSKFQGAITPPPKNRTVEVQHKSGGKHSFMYAELDVILEHVKKPFSENGFSWTSGLRYDPNGPMLVTRVFHNSGQWMEMDYKLPRVDDPKIFAGEVTYGRRYSFCMLMGVASQQDADEMPNAPRDNNRQQSNRPPQQPANRPANQPSAPSPVKPVATSPEGKPPQPLAPQSNSAPTAPSGTPPVVITTEPDPGPPQPEWRATQDHLAALNALVEDQTRFNPWTKDELKGYMAARFKKPNLGAYTKSEYELLMKTVAEKSCHQAIVEYQQLLASTNQGVK